MSEYIYTFASHEDESELCAMEARALFGAEPGAGGLLKSAVAVDPGRSPFVKERIEAVLDGDSVRRLAERARELELGSDTFKIVVSKRGDWPPGETATFERRHAIEREIGAEVRGRADVRRPDRVFGVTAVLGRWYMGPLAEGDAAWLRHRHKPHAYSIALPTRLARAAANIAVPRPAGVRAIDPCCGIGTVLVEALSMGIDMTGRDLNPLAVRGARENIAHFGLRADVRAGAIADVAERYDAAVVDLPYNHVSRITAEEQRSILAHARRIADRAVVLSIGPIEDELAAAGFAVLDRCVARKGSFARHVLLCE